MSLSLINRRITLYLLIIFIITSYHRFPLPWYLSSWSNGAPHHSGFKFHAVAPSLLRVNALLVAFTDILLVLWLQFQWSHRLLVWRRFPCSTFAEFRHSDFDALIYFQPPFALYSYPMVLILLSISEFYVLFLIIMYGLSARTCLYPSIPYYCCIFKFTFRLRYMWVPVLCCFHV